MGIRPAEEFVSPFLTMDAIRRTYDICPKPVNFEHFWEHNEEAPRAVAESLGPLDAQGRRGPRLDILPLLLLSMEPNFEEVQAPTLEELR
ncbi:hypothetical protein PIB30_109264, partial [Stylosanthes scabra]|nr:hypothetical protein [Stylosanthes scabra]